MTLHLKINNSIEEDVAKTILAQLWTTGPKLELIILCGVDEKTEIQKRTLTKSILVQKT